MNLNKQKDVCYSLLKKLIESKKNLIEIERKKEKWEAEQEIQAAFNRLDLKNEMQRKAFVLDQKYKPNSSWSEIEDHFDQCKLSVYQLEREYRIECLVFSALCQGINNEEIIGED